MQVRGQLLDGRLQVVHRFQAVLKETEEEVFQQMTTNVNRRGLVRFEVLLALSMEVLDEVLQQVHAFLDFDLIDFEEIL